MGNPLGAALRWVDDRIDEVRGSARQVAETVAEGARRRLEEGDVRRGRGGRGRGRRGAPAGSGRRPEEGEEEPRWEVMDVEDSGPGTPPTAEEAAAADAEADALIIEIRNFLEARGGAASSTGSVTPEADATVAENIRNTPRIIDLDALPEQAPEAAAAAEVFNGAVAEGADGGIDEPGAARQEDADENDDGETDNGTEVGAEGGRQEDGSLENVSALGSVPELEDVVEGSGGALPSSWTPQGSPFLAQVRYDAVGAMPESRWLSRDFEAISELEDEIGQDALLHGTLRNPGETYERAATRMTFRELTEKRREMEDRIRAEIREPTWRMSKRVAIDTILARAARLRRDEEDRAAQIAGETPENWDEES